MALCNVTGAVYLPSGALAQMRLEAPQQRTLEVFKCPNSTTL